MDSIAIKWKKQSPDKIDILTKKTHSQKRPARKVKIPFFSLDKSKFIIRLDSTSKTTEIIEKNRTSCSTNTSSG